MRSRLWVAGLLVLWGGTGWAQARAADGGGGGADEVGRALMAQWTISGDELRASGSRSLAEALAGRVPGLQVLMTPGALGSLAAVQLRAPVGLAAQGAPLVVVDGVPVETALAVDPDRAGVGDWWLVLGSIPVTDIVQVQVVRGLASSVGLGPRAYHGAILVTTRSAGRGIHGEIRQRAGVTARASSVESRRYTLEEARDHGLYGATPDVREAMWRACGGYCDLQDALFGGVRPDLATDAFGAWGATRTQATGSVSLRRTGTAVRGVSDDALGFRGSIQRSLWSTGSLRLAQHWSRVEGARPLDGIGDARSTRPIQYAPSYVDLRGVPGFPRESFSMNPRWAFDEMQAPRQLTEQLTTLSAVLPVAWGARHTLTATVLGGVHRVAQRDSARGAWLLDVVGSRSADARERWLHADLRHEATVRGMSLTTTLGVERSGQRASAMHRLVAGTAEQSQGLGSHVGTEAVLLASTARLAQGRTAASVLVRRDAWRGALQDLPSVLNWSAVVTQRLGGTTGPVARVAFARGGWRPAVQAPSTSVFFSPEDDHRREVEVGLAGTRHGDHVRWTATLFRSRASAIYGVGTSPPPGAFTGWERTDLESRGGEVTAAIDILRTPARAWTVEVLAAHARTRFATGIGGVQNLGFGVARSGAKGESITGFVPRTAPADQDAVGDAWPTLSYGLFNTLRHGPWRLDARVDGATGGSLPNWELAVSDEGGWTVDTLAARRRMAALQAGGRDYLQDASWLRVREVSLSRTIGRPRGPRDEPIRVSLIVHNALTLSGWRGLDPTVRSTALPTAAQYDAWATYPVMRSLSLAVSRAF